jgi:hypothetical protein
MVDASHPYMVEITKVENLEDAGDVVYTLEEVQEMVGSDYYGYNSNVRVRRDLVVTKLTELKTEMIEQNKRSIKITDAPLIEMFKTTEESVSDFVKGLRRVGDRLSLHDNTVGETKKRNKVLFSNMIWRGCRIFNGKTKLEIDIKYSDQDRHKALEVLKHLVTVEEIITQMSDEHRSSFTVSDFETIRLMWANLSDFFPIQAEENDQPA